MSEKHNIDGCRHETMRQRADILVDGIVQGVGFRYMMARTAREYGIKGYIKNLDDGTVQIVCEGTKEDINSFIDKIKNTPSPMRVDDVRTTYGSATGEFKAFKIIVGELGEEMVEGFSTGYQYLSRIDKKQDQMLEKQDQMLEKQDQTIQEIRGLSQSMHAMLDSRFEKLESEIAKIKAKLDI